MTSTRHLWAPLSIRVEQSQPIAALEALQYLEAFLNSPGCGLSDQNAIASLVRLQAGLQEEFEQVQGSTESDTPVANKGESSQAEEHHPKKLKRKSSAQPAIEVPYEQEDSDKMMKKKKKKRKEKKSKEHSQAE